MRVQQDVVLQRFALERGGSIHSRYAEDDVANATVGLKHGMRHDVEPAKKLGGSATTGVGG